MQTKSLTGPMLWSTNSSLYSLVGYEYRNQFNYSNLVWLFCLHRLSISDWIGWLCFGHTQHNMHHIQGNSNNFDEKPQNPIYIKFDCGMFAINSQ